MEVNKASFTFESKPELLIGGVKQEFKPIKVGNDTIQGVVLKDGTIARLKEHDDGTFKVTLTAADGKDLSKRAIRVQGGVLSRLQDKEGHEFDVLPDYKLTSGKKIYLNPDFTKKIKDHLTEHTSTIKLQVTPPPKKKDEDLDEIVIKGGEDQPKPIGWKPGTPQVKGEQQEPDKPSLGSRPLKPEVQSKPEVTPKDVSKTDVQPKSEVIQKDVPKTLEIT